MPILERLTGADSYTNWVALIKYSSIRRVSHWFCLRYTSFFCSSVSRQWRRSAPCCVCDKRRIWEISGATPARGGDSPKHRGEHRGGGSTRQRTPVFTLNPRPKDALPPYSMFHILGLYSGLIPLFILCFINDSKMQSALFHSTFSLAFVFVLLNRF